MAFYHLAVEKPNSTGKNAVWPYPYVARTVGKLSPNTYVHCIKFCRNVLCFPIRDGEDRVVGVAQLCNKPSGFTTLDEEASAALAVYCGIALTHGLIYKKMQQSQARSRLANELLLYQYHMAVTEQSVESVSERVEYKGLSISHWNGMYYFVTNGMIFSKVNAPTYL